MKNYILRKYHYHHNNTKTLLVWHIRLRNTANIYVCFGTNIIVYSLFKKQKIEFRDFKRPGEQKNISGTVCSWPLVDLGDSTQCKCCQCSFNTIPLSLKFALSSDSGIK